MFSEQLAQLRRDFRVVSFDATQLVACVMVTCNKIMHKRLYMTHGFRDSMPPKV